MRMGAGGDADSWAHSGASWVVGGSNGVVKMDRVANWRATATV